MAWNTPATAAPNSVLTAAMWNASVRDNLLETAPAKAQVAGRIIVTNGVNSVAERAISQGVVEASESTTSATYVDLTTTGPVVTVTTGGRALVWINTQLTNSSTVSSFASYSVTTAGVSTFDPADFSALIYDPPYAGGSIRAGMCDFRGVTAGSSTFTMKYRVTSNTGTFWRRRMHVMAL